MIPNNFIQFKDVSPEAVMKLSAEDVAFQVMFLSRVMSCLTDEVLPDMAGHAARKLGLKLSKRKQKFFWKMRVFKMGDGAYHSEMLVWNSFSDTHISESGFETKMQAALMSLMTCLVDLFLCWHPNGKWAGKHVDFPVKCCFWKFAWNAVLELLKLDEILPEKTMSSHIAFTFNMYESVDKLLLDTTLRGYIV